MSYAGNKMHIMAPCRTNGMVLGMCTKGHTIYVARGCSSCGKRLWSLSSRWGRCPLGAGRHRDSPSVVLIPCVQPGCAVQWEG